MFGTSEKESLNNPKKFFPSVLESAHRETSQKYNPIQPSKYLCSNSRQLLYSFLAENTTKSKTQILAAYIYLHIFIKIESRTKKNTWTNCMLKINERNEAKKFKGDKKKTNVSTLLWCP